MWPFFLGPISNIVQRLCLICRTCWTNLKLHCYTTALLWPSCRQNTIFFCDIFIKNCTQTVDFASFIKYLKKNNRLFELALFTQKCHWTACASWTRPSGSPASGFFCVGSEKGQIWPKRGERTDLTAVGFRFPLKHKQNNTKKQSKRRQQRTSLTGRQQWGE